MFEVQDLKFATLATVSRCGMIWFNEDVVTVDMVFHNYLTRLSNVIYGSEESDSQQANAFTPVGTPLEPSESSRVSPELQSQRDVVAILKPYFATNGLVQRCLEFVADKEHIMDFTASRAIYALLSMMNQIVREIHRYNAGHPDFPMGYDQIENFVSKSLVYAMLWSLTGDSKKKHREELGEFIRSASNIRLPSHSGVPLIDFEV